MPVGNPWIINAGKWAFNFWRQWSVELLLATSLGMQVVLSLLAGYRRRGASKAPLRHLIWFCYVSANYVATTALSNLSISRCWCSSGERQLRVFWVPFFLLHLGGPDNITAYEFEDNKLSKRSQLQLVLNLLGTPIMVYYSMSGSWTLIFAAWSMLVVGLGKYAERGLALYRANLDNLRSSLKLSKARHHGRNLMSAAVLMRAHSLFSICKHALVDSLLGEELDDDEAYQQIKEEVSGLKKIQVFSVMEMELSLMYDFLYTKASVMYTWHGYCIRALSPLAVLGSLVLVELSNHRGQGHNKQSDVVITRALHAATFFLETVSLLRALGSSWTGFLIWQSAGQAWFRHHLFCNNRWHRFRRAMASIGLLAKDPLVSHDHDEEQHHHRRWSGNIGQLNLFQRVTTSGPREKEQNSFMVQKEKKEQNLFWGGTEEQIKPDVKKVVYRRVRYKTNDFMVEWKRYLAAGEKVHVAAEFSTRWGQKTLRDYDLYDDLRVYLGPELQMGILTWHVGTNILFLNNSDRANKPSDEHQVEAIRTLSDYMMHLLVERPHMVPGLVTRHLLEQTRRELIDIWNSHKHAAIKVGKSETNSRQEQLAQILHDGHFDNGHQINTCLAMGIALGRILIGKDKEGFSKKIDDEDKGIVQMILEVWVEMLFYASYRCNKESHAKQLAYGGELTTIVWLLAEHAAALFVKTREDAKDTKN